MTVYEAALSIILTIVTHWTVQSIAALVLADVATGVAAAWRSKTFTLKHVADFMATMVGPYLLGYAGLRLATLGAPQLEPLAVFAWGCIELALLGSIRENLSELSGQEAPVLDPTPHG